MSDKEQEEIGYFNPSTKHVIQGFSAVYHAISSLASDMNEAGRVEFTQNLNGAPTRMSVNIKAQLGLDKQARGGDRLWQRIYEQDELFELLRARGIKLSKDDAEVKQAEEEAIKVPENHVTQTGKGANKSVFTEMDNPLDP